VVQVSDRPVYEVGYVSVQGLSREQPPMTPKEAVSVGNEIVADWCDFQKTRGVPHYCDNISALPSPEA
jgi:hypothetical protein